MNLPLKTSITDPIRVDFLESAPHNWRGKLGLTFAPGKIKPDGWTASWSRDLDTDLLRLRDFYGVTTLVSLIEKHEFEAVKINKLLERVVELGMKSVWFPILDRNVPTDGHKFADTIRAILTAIAAGETVVVHCMGGVGRAGTTAACCLVASGMDGDEAIAEVRRARPHAVETDVQRDFIRTFAALYNGG